MARIEEIWEVRRLNREVGKIERAKEIVVSSSEGARAGEEGSASWVDKGSKFE
jgi:hypothetical protein